MIIKRFPNVINSSDINCLQSEFLGYQAASDKELPASFDEDDKPIRLAQNVLAEGPILWSTSFPASLSWLKFCSSFVIVMHTVKVFLAPSERSAQMVDITLERMLKKDMLLQVCTKTQHQLGITYLAY